MTNEKYKALIAEHLKKYNFGECDVRYTNSVKKLGAVVRDWDGNIVRFEFSKHLHKATDDQIQDTILHEIAHGLDIMQRGTSDHGPRWKEIAMSIGANPASKAKEAVFGREMYRYHLVCDTCGEIVGHRRTMQQKTRVKISHSYHPTCGTSSRINIVDTKTKNIRDAAKDESIEIAGDTFTAVDLARSLGICPKAARKKLRASLVDHLKIGNGWEFKMEHLKRITEIIS